MKEKLTIQQMPSVEDENLIHLNRYVKFINSRPVRKLRQRGFHTHHIYPKSMAKKNAIDDYNGDWNLIELTPREHFIAHMILFYCGYTEMTYAFRRMCSKNKISGAMYEKLQKKRAELSRVWFLNYHKTHNTSGVNSPLYGKERSREHCDHIAKAKKGKPNKKLKGRKQSQEFKDHLSKVHTGMKASAETKLKMSISHIGRTGPNKGKTFGQSTRLKVSIANKGKRYITDGMSFTFIQKDKSLPVGWYFYKKINKKDAYRFILSYTQCCFIVNEKTIFCIAKYKWINNGNISRKISCFNSTPFMWDYGKLKLITTKNKISITNGLDNKFIEKSEAIPSGWKRGSTHKKTQVKTVN